MTGAAFTSNGTENRMRWDRRARDFMEVWYATATHRKLGSGLWLRYTVTAPSSPHAEPYCQLWAFYFDPEGKTTFAGRNQYPADRLGSANGRDDGALVRIGDAWLSENHLEGAVTAGDRRLSWSIDFEPADRCYQHLPVSVRDRIERRLSTVCSPNLAVPFTGSVDLDGERIPLDGEPGSQSHRWGRAHSHAWSWAHCSEWEESADAVFEGLVARPARRAPASTLLYLRYRGEDLAFNGLVSSFRSKSRFDFPTWAFSAQSKRFKVVGAARTRLARTIQVRYDDPDGGKRYCANSEIADLGLEVYERGASGWRHSGSLTAMGTAHLEFGRPEPFAELPVAF